MTGQKPDVSSDGEGLEIPYTEPDRAYTIFIPFDLLEDVVGDASSLDECKTWVEENVKDITQAAKAKLDGGVVRKPFDQVILRENN